jgi:hypothetical protein
MPRKRPGSIRKARAHRATWRTVPRIPGLPASAQQEVSQIELRTAHNWAHFGLWPGAVAEALTGWSATARNPARRQFHPCGCCGRGSRAILQEALDQLPGPSATALGDWAFAVWAIIPTATRVMERRLTNGRHAAAATNAAGRKAA